MVTPLERLEPSDRRSLTAARDLLEHPSLAARLTSLVGLPLEEAVRLLPRAASERVHRVAEGAILRALAVALRSLPGRAPAASRTDLHRVLGMATGAAPFDSFQVADIGDVPINSFDLLKSVDIIEAFYDDIVAQGAKPVSIGGDHTIALPILRALHKKHGPMGLVHVDAHADINDRMFGERIAHGTIFRRAVEEGLVDPHRMGAGIGRRLLHQAMALAKTRGAVVMKVQSDPGAAPFYAHAGGRATGHEASRSIPGRLLPMFEFVLQDSA